MYYVETPAIASIIDVMKTTVWGESGFPARLLDLRELLEREAFLAYRVNDQDIPKFGYPLRLAIPGKYGYQWAKWVVKIELVADQRKGYWPGLGLPDRGDLGDIW